MDRHKPFIKIHIKGNIVNINILPM